MPRSLALLLIGLLLGGGIGFFLAAANNVALDGHHHAAAEDAGHAGIIDLPAGPDAPTLDFRVTRDAGSGWNLQILTTGFRFAPERVNAPHRPGRATPMSMSTGGNRPGSTDPGSISARCRQAKSRSALRSTPTTTAS